MELQYIVEGRDPITYTTATELPEGKSGKCYIVTDVFGNKEGQQREIKKVIKVCTRGNSTKFKNAAREHLVNKLEGFVAVEEVGKVKIEGVTDYQLFPQGNEAMKMSYEGSDLYAVLYDHLEKSSGKVEDNVINAFKYKVLYTVIEALIKAHDEPAELGFPHRDLNPANIVCGFDLAEVRTTGTDEKRITPEDCLIKSRILLCDRETGAVSDPEESLRYASLGRRDPKLMSYFVCSDDRLNPKEKDIYAVLALYAVLERGRRRHPDLVLFAKKLGFDIYDNGREEYTLPSLIGIMTKLNSEIEKSNYFILDERRNPQDQAYPVIYRPLDRFREWEKKLPSMTSVDELRKMIENDAFSYDHLLKRSLPALERTQMSAELAEFLKDIAQNLDQVIIKKTEDSKKTREDEKTVSVEIAKLEDTIRTTQARFEKTKKDWVKALQEYTQSQSNDNLTNLTTFHNGGVGYATAIERANQDMTAKMKQLGQINQQLKAPNFNPEEEEKALGYIKSVCLPRISGTKSNAQSQLLEILDRRVPST